MVANRARGGRRAGGPEGGCAGAPTTLRPSARATQRLAAKRGARKAADKQHVVILQGESDGHPAVVTAYTSIRSVDHPLQSTHAKVEIALENPTDVGFTTQAEADVQNAVQDDLEAAVGDAGIVVARETSNGRRIIHFYVDPQSDAPHVMREWCTASETRAATLEITHEPDWASVRQFGLR